uniref:Aldo-keto reductase n=1 Tax=Riptortus pedestris TaxID=329032 RepID=R4WP87_RIPPE|nr:aldo-keto reductase [Riptortus pedestris]
MAKNLTINSVVTSGQMRMPIVGLGTWQATEKEIYETLTTAIASGYRHIDTAYMYENEKYIGQTLNKLFSEGKLKREDIFIVTKLPLIANRAEYVETFLKRSLESLQLDYVDLYLVHHPVGFKNHGPDNIFPKDENDKLDVDFETEHLTLWKAMEDQVDAGRAKSIGVSNFNISQMRRILENCRIPIANTQVELNIYLQQPDLVSFCKENDITVCAYAPLGSPGYIKGLEKYGYSSEGAVEVSPLSEPIIVDIARKYNKLPAQVLLRYLIEYGVAVIPKSTNPERIKQNIDIFDFELTEDEFSKIRALDRGEKGRVFSSMGIFSVIRDHPEYPFPKDS